MTLDIEKVKTRIRQLLNVAENDAATEGEINNALKFAQNLLNKHHLSEEDITGTADPVLDLDRMQKGIFKAPTGSSKVYAWESWLGSFVKEFVGSVGCYLDGSMELARSPQGIAMKNTWDEAYQCRPIVFYGIAEDAKMAAEIYHELRTTIAAMGRLKFGSCYRKDGGKYCEGFVSGLNAKMREARRVEKIEAPSTGTALILIEKRNEVIERKMEIARSYAASVGLRFVKGEGRYGADGSSKAWEEGHRDGTNTDVSATRRPKIS